MDPDALFLSRIQFAFTVSFHVIFPAFTVGLAAWLATLQGLYVFTGNDAYDRLFRFWLKIFAVAFGMGVVSGIVMAFQFGTNWSVFSAKAGPIMGPLLAYESFTAFLLEATFLGVLLFGRDRVPKFAYFLSAVAVAFGTTLSSYWILVNNSWMQEPAGMEMIDGFFAPADWMAILFSEAVITRLPHMLLAAYVTTSFCVAATGAWYLLRGRSTQESRIMLAMGLGFAAIVLPIQIWFGHEAGSFIRDKQPAKYAAFEGRWETQEGADFVIFALPNSETESNDLEIAIPKLGSWLVTGDWESREVGIKAFAPEDRPPLWIPFFTFRLMVGLGILMLAVSWVGVILLLLNMAGTSRWFLWITFLSFPSGFIAIMAGWFASEVGRQPWIVQDLMRTEDGGSPVGVFEVAVSLTVFVLIYTLIFSAGTFYIYRLLKKGLDEVDQGPADDGTARRPLAAVVEPLSLDDTSKPQSAH